MSDKLRTSVEIAGSDENLKKLLEALEPWKCCGQPQMCSVSCQDDMLSAALALSHTLVKEEIRRRYESQVRSSGWGVQESPTS
jgi:hypothetical protein